MAVNVKRQKPTTEEVTKKWVKCPPSLGFVKEILRSQPVEDRFSALDAEDFLGDRCVDPRRNGGGEHEVLHLRWLLAQDLLGEVAKQSIGDPLRRKVRGRRERREAEDGGPTLGL